MAAKNPTSDPHYSRRLDRSLENEDSNVARLSEEDRRKIYGLRSAFENTLSKLHKLEESNNEK